MAVFWIARKLEHEGPNVLDAITTQTRLGIDDNSQMNTRRNLFYVYQDNCVVVFRKKAGKNCSVNLKPLTPSQLFRMFKIKK